MQLLLLLASARRDACCIRGTRMGVLVLPFVACLTNHEHCTLKELTFNPQAATQGLCQGGIQGFLVAFLTVDVTAVTPRRMPQQTSLDAGALRGWVMLP